jgi:hypothetical protein
METRLRIPVSLRSMLREMRRISQPLIASKSTPLSTLEAAHILLFSQESSSGGVGLAFLALFWEFLMMLIAI